MGFKFSWEDQQHLWICLSCVNNLICFYRFQYVSIFSMYSIGFQYVQPSVVQWSLTCAITRIKNKWSGVLDNPRLAESAGLVDMFVMCK